MQSGLKDDRPFTIRLLGTPDMIWHDEHWELPRRQARALLYRLAAAETPASRQYLGFLFWADTPETQARRNLNRLLSYLRRQLPVPEMLVLQGEGVQLDLERCRSDVLDFQHLRRNHNPTSLEQAAALVRGDFLEGFELDGAREYERWVSESRLEIERALLHTLNALARLQLRAGHYEAAIATAHRYLNIDMLSEPMHVILLEAYAHIGNRTAAQHQYERLAITLESELGVSPLPETQALFQSILSRGFDLQRSKAPLQALHIRPGLNLPLIGREGQLERLSRAVAGQISGGLVLVSGEAGIGKSRLLEAFAASYPDLVLVGSSHPTTTQIAYQPVTQALRQALDKPWSWSAIPAIWLSEASRLLPNISRHFPDLPPRLQLEPAQAQARLLEALTQICIHLAAGAGTLLLGLDDVHWMDEDSRTWLDYLIKQLPGSQVIVLATFRSELAEKVQAFRRGAARLGCLAEIDLPGLDLPSACELIAAADLPSPVPQELAKTLHQVTAGNPFYLLEILAAYAETTAPLPAKMPAELLIPSSLHDLVQGRLDRLPPIERQVIEAAAIAAPLSDLDLLQYIAGRPAWEVSQALEALVTRNFLTADRLKLHFRHEIIRTVVDNLLSPWRKQLLHRRAGEGLQQLTTLKIENRHAWQGYHYTLGGMLGEAVRAFDLAAADSLSRYAFQSALNYLDQALALAERVDFPRQDLSRLNADRGKTLIHLGHLPEAETAFRQALTICPPGEHLALAQVTMQYADTYLRRFLLDDCRKQLEQALSLLGSVKTSHEQKVWLEIQLMRMSLFYYQSLPDEIEKLAPHIEPLLNRHGSPAQQIQYLALIDQVHLRQHRYQVRDEHILANEAQAYQIALESGDPVLIGERHFANGMISWFRGDLGQAIEAFESGLDIAQKLKLASLENQCLVYLIAVLRMAGETTRIREALSRCQQVAEQAQNLTYLGAARAHAAWLALQDGDAVLARAEAQAALAWWQKTPTYPFQWLANTVLFKLNMAAGDIDGACRAAYALHAPPQQWLTNEIHAIFDQVVGLAGDSPEELRAALWRAWQVLEAAGYC